MITVARFKVEKTRDWISGMIEDRLRCMAHRVNKEEPRSLDVHSYGRMLCKVQNSINLAHNATWHLGDEDLVGHMTYDGLLYDLIVFQANPKESPAHQRVMREFLSRYVRNDGELLSFTESTAPSSPDLATVQVSLAFSEKENRDVISLLEKRVQKTMFGYA